MVNSKDHWKAWLYLSPAIVLLLIFTVWPIINNAHVPAGGVQRPESASGAGFEFGLGNFVKVKYRKVPDLPAEHGASVPVDGADLHRSGSFWIAVVLNSIKFLQKALQTIFFLPYVTNSIAIGMVFAAMFNIVGSFYGTENEIVVTAGIINNIIEFFGGTRVNWINYGSSYTANMVVMISSHRSNHPPSHSIPLGGLQAINRQYYEAARVDSTPRWRVFTRITVPLVSPMLAYVVITGFIGGFKEYTSIVGIFGETMGPPNDGGRLNTMVGFIYDSLSNNSQGRASAAALILFGIILVVTLINLWVSKKRVH